MQPLGIDRVKTTESTLNYEYPKKKRTLSANVRNKMKYRYPRNRRTRQLLCFRSEAIFQLRYLECWHYTEPMNPTQRLKSTLCQYASESVISEIAVEARVLFLTRLPNLLFPWRRSQLRKIRQQTGLKVNIGCGPFLEDGWIGLDYRSPNAIRCDIKHHLPFEDGSCRFLFSEHVFEHLDLRELGKVLAECKRVLEPNGVLRIVMPDLDKYVTDYVENRDAKALNEVFHAITHRFIHSFSTIKAELLDVGFRDVQRSEFRRSAHPDLNIDCDLPNRIAESLYLEATK